jgi:hypothetical protein
MLFVSNGYWVKFQVLTAASMKMTAFWVLAACSVVGGCF